MDRGVGYTVAAAGASGCVALWDRRKGQRPAAVLSAPVRSGGLNALQVDGTGLLVTSGTEGGDLVAWDLRGGRQSVQQFGGSGAYAHGLLFSRPLSHNLRSLAGLSYKVGPQSSQIRLAC